MATGSAAEVEEERRLLYVGCTRAREQLYVSHPLRYYTQPWNKADTHGYAQRSRFLTQTVASHFEQIQTGPEHAESDEASLERVTTASIRAGVRSLWQTPAPA
jgi:DNA helicase-2/ATP-dependent DNA helicase PcrA